MSVCDSIGDERRVDFEKEWGRPILFVVSVAAGLLSLAASEARGQAAITVAPETQSVEEGSYAYIDVALTAQPEESVTLSMIRSSSRLSAPRPLSLSFTPGSWSTPQTVRWQAMSDDDGEDEDVSLTFFLVEDRDVFARAMVRVEYDDAAGESIRLCDARLGLLEPHRVGEELDICWESGTEIPLDADVVIEARRKSFWDDPHETFSPWREVGSGARYTRCGMGSTCAQYTESGLWRGSALTVQMRTRRGENVLAMSPRLQVQAPNSDSAGLNAALAVVDWTSSEGVQPAGRFRMQLVFTDPLVYGLTTELVQGLEASDFTVSNGTVPDAGYWDGGTYRVLVEPEILGHPVMVSLPAGTVIGVGEGVSASGGNNYTRDNTASNIVVHVPDEPEGYADRSELFVEDSEVREEHGALLVFKVFQGGISPGRITVDYETADGTATAGMDYEPRSGTLVFQPGETMKTVAVSVLEDLDDEADEDLTLTLSNVWGATLGRAQATGVIVNGASAP